MLSGTNFRSAWLSTSLLPSLPGLCLCLLAAFRTKGETSIKHSGVSLHSGKAALNRFRAFVAGNSTETLTAKSVGEEGTQPRTTRAEDRVQDCPLECESPKMNCE